MDFSGCRSIACGAFLDNATKNFKSAKKTYTYSNLEVKLYDIRVTALQSLLFYFGVSHLQSIPV